MNERDETRLRDMRDEIYRVQEFLEGEEKETFFQNTMLAYAVIRAITIVGEAANHVSPTISNRASRDPLAQYCWYAQPHCTWLR